jgi:hypothetical protein
MCKRQLRSQVRIHKHFDILRSSLLRSAHMASRAGDVMAASCGCSRYDAEHTDHTSCDLTNSHSRHHSRGSLPRADGSYLSLRRKSEFCIRSAEKLYRSLADGLGALRASLCIPQACTLPKHNVTGSRARAQQLL